jgi:hypothetical protein
MKEQEFYCLNIDCRRKRKTDPDDMYLKISKNKRTGQKVPMLRSECPVCGTKMSKFVKHASVPKLKEKYDVKK